MRGIHSEALSFLFPAPHLGGNTFRFSFRKKTVHTFKIPPQSDFILVSLLFYRAACVRHRLVRHEAKVHHHNTVSNVPITLLSLHVVAPFRLSSFFSQTDFCPLLLALQSSDDFLDVHAASITLKVKRPWKYYSTNIQLSSCLTW